MSDVMTRRHGLEAFLSARPQAGSEKGLKVDIRADLGHLNLRGNPSDPEFFAAVNQVLGQALPVDANTMTSGDHRVYWLGPDEWQIVAAVDETASLTSRLREALADMHGSVSNLSGGQIALHLSGIDVRNVLVKGCTLDLAPAEFGADSCAQTGLAKANMLIGLIDGAEPTFEIVLRRSFADYGLRWLQHAASEFGASFRDTH